MTDDARLESDVHKLQKLIERKRYQQAETLLGEALRNEPDDPDLLYYSAYLSMVKKDYPEAEKTLKTLLQIEPEDAEARFLLAHVYQDLKRYGEAEQLIIELLRQYPENSTFYAYYSEIMLETLHIEKAHKLAREAVRLDPENISAQSVSVLCEVIQNNRQQTLEQLAELVRNYPEARTTSAMAMVVLNNQGRYREALKVAMGLLKADPGDEDVLQAVVELKTLTHPTMLPLFPLTRYGWHGSAVLWFVGISFFYVSNKYLPKEVTLTLMGGWVLYLLYSWVYPPILRKILS